MEWLPILIDHHSLTSPIKTIRRTSFLAPIGDAFGELSAFKDPPRKEDHGRNQRNVTA